MTTENNATEQKVEIEGFTFPNIDNYLQGIMNSFIEKVEENSKLIKDYKEKLNKDI